MEHFGVANSAWTIWGSQFDAASSAWPIQSQNNSTATNVVTGRFGANI